VFNASPDELLWYDTSVRDSVGERLPGSSGADALGRAVAQLHAAGATSR
jgi:hypothetical protein